MSREGWRETTLGEVVLINPKVPKLQEDSPFIEMADVDTWGRWAFPSGPKDKRGGIRATGGDTLMARITPCLENGKIAQIPDVFGDVGGSTEFIVLRATDETIPEFVFLLAQSHRVHSESIGLMVGTSGRQRVSAKDVASIQIFLPPVEEQREIVNLMQALDHMIQAGDREISSAEQMRGDVARTLIRQVGEEFESKSLHEVVEYHDNKRKPVKKADRVPGPYPYYGASGIADYVDNFLFEGLHLLVAEDGENIRTRKLPIAFLANGKFWVNNHAHIVKADIDTTTKYVALAVEYSDISAYITGSSRPKITKTACQSIKVPFPPLEEQEKIVEKMQALDAYLESAKRSQEALMQVRKDALHALLSGDKDVRDLAKMFPTNEAVA